MARFLKYKAATMPWILVAFAFKKSKCGRYLRNNWPKSHQFSCKKSKYGQFFVKILWKQAEQAFLWLKLWPKGHEKIKKVQDIFCQGLNIRPVSWLRGLTWPRSVQEDEKRRKEITLANYRRTERAVAWVQPRNSVPASAAHCEKHHQSMKEIRKETSD